MNLNSHPQEEPNSMRSVAKDRSVVSTRRTFLAGAAAAAAGSATVSSVAVHRLSTVRPVIELTAMPWWHPWDPAAEALLASAAQEFASTHKGLRVKLIPGPSGGPIAVTTVFADCVAGVGPDVIASCCGSFPVALATGVAAPLDPYLMRDGIDPTSVWPSGQMAGLTTEGHVWGLPVYSGPRVWAYNQSILDQLGLEYPTAEWTYKEAETFFRRTAGTVQVAGRTQRRYGASLQGYNNWNYLLIGFGGAEMDASRTRALLDLPQSIRAGEWIYGLLWEDVVAAAAVPPYPLPDLVPHAARSMRNGTAVFEAVPESSVLSNVLAWGQNFKWDYIQPPRYPNGPAEGGNNDVWYMNTQAKNPDAAWELLKWFTFQDYWQTFMMRTLLLAPAKKSLWPIWESTVRQVAPLLREKNIGAFADAVDYNYGEQWFRYNPEQADGILAPWWGKLAARAVDVPLAFHSMTAQENAFQSAMRASQATDAVSAAVLASLRTSPADQHLPPPPMTGAGAVQAVAAPTLMATRGGMLWLTGTGATLGPANSGGFSDNCAFAPVADQESAAEYVCRLDAFEAMGGSAMSASAAAGLMARADLSDNAPAVAVLVTAGDGVIAIDRSNFGLYFGENSPGFAQGFGNLNASGAAGLLPTQTVMTAVNGAVANHLLKPVWLKLSRRGLIWTAFISTDGATWLQAGGANEVVMAGAWVGVCATASTSGVPASRGTARVRAGFSRLSFSPGICYQIGHP